MIALKHTIRGALHIEKAKASVRAAATLRDNSLGDDKVCEQVLLGWLSIANFCNSDSTPTDTLTLKDDFISKLPTDSMNFPAHLSPVRWSADLQHLKNQMLNPGEQTTTEESALDINIDSHLRFLETFLSSLPPHKTPPGRSAQTKGGLFFLTTLMIGAYCWFLFPNHPWQAQFFKNAHLEGPPAKVYDIPHIDFEWNGLPPWKDFPHDYFSVRFVTCLHLLADSDVGIEIVSDDGIKLRINDALTFSSWQKQSLGPSTSWKNLEEGVHQITVEYFEAERTATVRTELFVGEAAIEDSPVAYLTFPRTTASPGEDACS